MSAANAKGADRKMEVKVKGGGEGGGKGKGKGTAGGGSKDRTDAPLKGVKACTACRAAKVKCDAQQPCRRCVSALSGRLTCGRPMHLARASFKLVSNHCF